ncbi:MAG: amidohydrolase family protein [Nocardioidaceae bacterium]
MHCTFNTPEEWDLLDDSGVMVSVCAETEMQMGMGYPAISEVTRHTPGPSLGIDCVSGNSGDMISHSRLVLQASRYRADEPGYQQWLAPQVMSWTTRDALSWITINGAKAAGVDDVAGSLTPGKRADIVLLEMGGVSQAGLEPARPRRGDHLAGPRRVRRHRPARFRPGTGQAMAAWSTSRAASGAVSSLLLNELITSA